MLKTDRTRLLHMYLTLLQTWPFCFNILGQMLTCANKYAWMFRQFQLGKRALTELKGKLFPVDHLE